MKKHKNTLLVLLGISVLVWAIACVGGGTPVPISDIPVYPGATPLQKGEDDFIDTLVEGMEEAAAEEEDVTAEVQAYTVGADVTWEDVKSFYTDKMAGTDWQLSDELTQDSEGFNMIGWERSGQALGIGYVPPLLSDNATIIILLATE